MAKSNTIQIKLVSTADTGYFYVTKKNPRAKTEKLKALRLARDAAAPPPAATKRRGKAKGKSGSLSDWLDGEAKEGRNG